MEEERRGEIRKEGEEENGRGGRERRVGRGKKGWKRKEGEK